MKDGIVSYYRYSEDFSRYTVANRKRVKEIRDIYNTNRAYFGKSVLDIACGGGILGFILEPLRIRYTGIDINPDMISAARARAKSIGSKNEFALKDARKLRIKGIFNTITLLGNALGDIPSNDFLEIVKSIQRNSRKGTYFIVDYRDVVYLLAKRLWRDRMVEKDKGKTVISLSIGVDTENGNMLKQANNLDDKKSIRFTHAIWAPFIIEPLMKAQGWGLVKRRRTAAWSGWLDVYRKV